jgi:hypothetical protein
MGNQSISAVSVLCPYMRSKTAVGPHYEIHVDVAWYAVKQRLDVCRYVCAYAGMYVGR